MLVLTANGAPPRDAYPPKLREIEFKVAVVGGATVITVSLTAGEKRDLFKVFCDDLHEAIGHVASDEEAVQRLFTRAARWHHFMRSGSGRVLSDREQRGLFAELSVLREVAAPAIGIVAAVGAWRGPFGDQQDFAIEGRRLEVKSTEPSSPRSFEVSSERQLDYAATDGDTLALALVEVARVGSDEGESLAELVAAIREDCERAAPAALAAFDGRLAASGYCQNDAYEIARWDVWSLSIVKVDGRFPAIRASELPPSITHVRYTCDLAGVELQTVHNPFQATSEEE